LKGLVQNSKNKNNSIHNSAIPSFLDISKAYISKCN